MRDLYKVTNFVPDLTTEFKGRYIYWVCVLDLLLSLIIFFLLFLRSGMHVSPTLSSAATTTHLRKRMVCSVGFERAALIKMYILRRKIPRWNGVLQYN